MFIDTQEWRACACPNVGETVRKISDFCPSWSHKTCTVSVQPCTFSHKRGVASSFGAGHPSWDPHKHLLCRLVRLLWFVITFTSISLPRNVSQVQPAALLQDQVTLLVNFDVHDDGHKGSSKTKTDKEDGISVRVFNVELVVIPVLYDESQLDVINNARTKHHHRKSQCRI